jgi:hypothetical protein
MMQIMRSSNPTNIGEANGSGCTKATAISFGSRYAGASSSAEGCESEVDRLIEAARKRGRNGPRDSAAILLAYRHGLHAQELCSLRWAQVDLRHGRFM